jgi:sulfotransferase
MQGDIHFISGLPRAGSTLLSAILRQNPRFHAGMTGPVGSLIDAMLRNMSMSNETSIFITDVQRRALLQSIFSTYYADVPKGDVVFDTNRNWCARLPLLTELFPRQGDLLRARRSLDTGLDRKTDPQEQVSAVGHLQFRAGRHGVFAGRRARQSQRHGRLRLERAARGLLPGAGRLPAGVDLRNAHQQAIAAVYDFIGEKPFAHDFQNIEFDAEEFDRRLGTPGLHRVGRRVESPGRKSVLPGDLVRKYENDVFWRDPARNPNQVKVI